jgi:hypothetical protein
VVFDIKHHFGWFNVIICGMSSPTPPIRVILADDHAVVRAGIRQFLETSPRLEVIAEASNGEEA